MRRPQAILLMSSSASFCTVVRGEESYLLTFLTLPALTMAGFLEATACWNRVFPGQSQASFEKNKCVCHLSAQVEKLEKMNARGFKKIQKGGKKKASRFQ